MEQESERKVKGGKAGLLMALLLAVSVFALPVSAQAQATQGSGLDFLGMGQKGGICSALTLGWGAASGPVGALGGMMCGLTFGQLGNNLITNTLGMGMMSYFLTKEKVKSELKGEESQSQEMTVNPITISTVIAESDFYGGAATLGWAGEGQEAIESIAGQPQKIWKRKLALANPNSKEGLFDGVLKVTAIKSEYNTDYGTLDYGKRIYRTSAEGIPLSVKNAPSFEEDFHFRVKALSPEKIVEPEAPRAVDCLSKYFKGKTGADALPKVKLDWTWGNIGNVEAGQAYKGLCDEGYVDADNNPASVYCDATQFSIEVIAKLTRLYSELVGSAISCNANESLDACLERVNPDPSSKKTVLDLTHFKAYLIKDGYSADFQKDFDTYYRFTNFAGTADYYLSDPAGLHKYFTDRQLFRFVPAYDEGLQGDLLLESPGIYNVTIKVDFNQNASIGLFDSGNNPTASIKVVLDRFDVAKPDNVFYYLPFDGLVGIEGQSIERNGYGVNYSGDVIKINDAVESLSVGHGVSLKTIEVKTEDSFKAVNNDKRGRLLEVGQDSMVWSPSHATPVILKTTKGARGGDAYAFYALDIEGQAAETGSWLLPWTGIGLKCRDFSGDYITNLFDETTDLHAINRQCGLTDPIEEGIAYGLNWCNLPENSKAGSVYLRTIAYTPQGKTGSLTLGGASDSAKFLDLSLIGTEATEYNLNGALFTGTTGKTYNEAGNAATYLKSVQDLLELVKDNYACISSTGASNASFWWNPVELHNLYANIENDISQPAGTAEPKCIVE